MDAHGSLKVRVRVGIVASGHNKQDDQDGDWQVRQAAHAAGDLAPPRPFLLQAKAGAAQDRYRMGARHVQGKDKKDDPGHVRTRVCCAGSRLGRHPAWGVSRIRVASGQKSRLGAHRIHHQGSQAVRGARTGQDPRKGRGEDEFRDVRGIPQGVAR